MTSVPLCFLSRPMSSVFFWSWRSFTFWVSVFPSSVTHQMLVFKLGYPLVCLLTVNCHRCWKACQWLTAPGCPMDQESAGACNSAATSYGQRFQSDSGLCSLVDGIFRQAMPSFRPCLQSQLASVWLCHQAMLCDIDLAQRRGRSSALSKTQRSHVKRLRHWAKALLKLPPKPHQCSSLGGIRRLGVGVWKHRRSTCCFPTRSCC